MPRSRILIAAVATGLAATGLVATAVSQDQPFGNEEDTAYSQTLWERLNEENLAGDNAVNTVPYEGTDPHGVILETLYRDIDVEGHTGLVVVKRNYGPEGVTVEDVQGDRGEHMDSITVMFKREQGYDPENQDWFWAKYLADGSLDQNPQGMSLAGRVGKGADQGCIPCHAQAAEGDYLYTFNLQ
ncbi:cytochrome P460 family protein [Chelativorans salis]|uniref:Cytochrome P460 family protein n=1 Tax=Chelativorans salis TaxID=2978478 RepID=A0ABT2LPC5_9HYPH|nr:cytochrome P460 family protein [Chelativorans sp. EGI FJ00035]MCT7376156.1 cytochrome P460 family protein [Chelativorans sp. EGI FJ00035]